jgi:hypothetical protein
MLIFCGTPVLALAGGALGKTIIWMRLLHQVPIIFKEGMTFATIEQCIRIPSVRMTEWAGSRQTSTPKRFTTSMTSITGIKQEEFIVFCEGSEHLVYLS